MRTEERCFSELNRVHKMLFQMFVLGGHKSKIRARFILKRKEEEKTHLYFMWGRMIVLQSIHDKIVFGIRKNHSFDKYTTRRSIN